MYGDLISVQASLVNKIAPREHAGRDRFECDRHVGSRLIFSNTAAIGIHDGIRATLNPSDAVRSNLSAARDQPLNRSNAGNSRRVGGCWPRQPLLWVWLLPLSPIL